MDEDMKAGIRIACGEIREAIEGLRDGSKAKDVIEWLEGAVAMLLGEDEARAFLAEHL